MSQVLTGLLVGSYHRPPAKSILEHLPTGAPLVLQAEPENPYDAGAIKVLLDPADAIPKEQYQPLADKLPLQGYTLEQVMSGGPLQLGYLAATGGKPLAKGQQAIGQGLSLAGNSEFAPWVPTDTGAEARLAFGPGGELLVQLRMEEEP